MEAALRTAYEVATGKTLPKIDFTEARGLEGVKEFSVDLNGSPVKCAVVHSKNIHQFLEKIKKGEVGSSAMPHKVNPIDYENKYDFVEVMACPGGCINGGGQPRPRGKGVVEKRMNAIYEIDAKKTLRKSHESQPVQVCCVLWPVDVLANLQGVFREA